MSTKKQIAEQAMRILSGGHLKPDRTIDIREVMLNLDQLRDEAVRASVIETLRATGRHDIDEHYLSFYESVTVNTDAVKSLRYITLPANVISLPRGIGLYQITPIGDIEDRYVIVRPGAAGHYTGTQALEHELNVYCWPVSGSKVYFKNLDVAITEVTVLMASSSKDIAESDDYPVPPDAEDKLLKSLLQMFGVMQQIPHDELEDGQK